MTYPFAEIELARQRRWEDDNAFAAEETAAGDKFYCLSMFPYPSGRLHMGHVRNYTIGDMLSRYRRMLGDNVLQPMGWDAFGLPAENAAIDHGIHPAKWTYRNIAEMRAQLKRLGLAVDWRRELATCDPEYYRWEQLLFVRMFKQGLVYKKTAAVNWDPTDQTVLANEQVVDGRGWRSGAPIERRDVPMYFMKITDYAEELLSELDNLPGWPESVKVMQRNWIGRSSGARVFWEIDGRQELLEVFTTRPDTLFGATFCAIAPEHPLARSLAKTDAAVRDFIADCRSLAVNEEALAALPKRGCDTGLRALHPLDESRRVPVFVANFVLMQYGAGAIYGCPAHDQRDLDFARQYQLPVIPVVLPDGEAAATFRIRDAAHLGGGTIINSAQLNGMDSKAAKRRAVELLEAAGRGRGEVQYRLRDWGISRQRYWGCPIPVVHCPRCGDVAVDEIDLPVKLPTDAVIDGRGSPLAKMESFIRCTCPQCKGKARRETDTMDTFVESSWYFSRFASYDCGDNMVDARVLQWMPVNQYIGGIEHACLHLLYARFFHKVMRDAGLFAENGGTGKHDEPFRNLLCQGMVLKDGAKMSKSRGNTVDPRELIDAYGADTTRLFILFAAPPAQMLEWSDEGVKGAHRFLNRLWNAALELPAWRKTLSDKIAPNGAPVDAPGARCAIHRLLAKADYDMARLRFNNIPSAAMQIVNELQSFAKTALLSESLAAPAAAAAAELLDEGFSIVLRLLSPAVPHISEELWRRLNFGDSVIDAPWPVADIKLLQHQPMQTLVVQVNGKRRGVIEIAAAAEQSAIETAAMPFVQKHLPPGGGIRRVVVVEGKVINFVVA